MSTLPKPQPCGQHWLDMKPTANGRLCGQCDKEIYDFSAMSWPAIAHTQAAHGNALCGMYSPAQLAHWGQSPPSACARLASATALAVALSTVPAQGQVPSGTTSLTLSGTVSTTNATGSLEPVPYATVRIAGTELGVATDEQGHYELAVPDSVGTTHPITFSSIGFNPSVFTLSSPSAGLLRHDVLLTASTNVIVFSVRKPSPAERIKWTLKRWFGRQ
jgi:hypothetical protein